MVIVIIGVNYCDRYFLLQIDDDDLMCVDA